MSDLRVVSQEYPQTSSPIVQHPYYQDHADLAQSLCEHLGLEKAILVCKQNAWQGILDVLANMRDQI